MSCTQLNSYMNTRILKKRSCWRDINESLFVQTKLHSLDAWYKHCFHTYTHDNITWLVVCIKRVYSLSSMYNYGFVWCMDVHYKSDVWYMYVYFESDVWYNYVCTFYIKLKVPYDWLNSVVSVLKVHTDWLNSRAEQNLIFN